MTFDRGVAVPSRAALRSGAAAGSGCDRRCARHCPPRVPGRSGLTPDCDTGRGWEAVRADLAVRAGRTCHLGPSVASTGLLGVPARVRWQVVTPPVSLCRAKWRRCRVRPGRVWGSSPVAAGCCCGVAVCGQVAHTDPGTPGQLGLCVAAVGRSVPPWVARHEAVQHPVPDWCSVCAARDRRAGPRQLRPTGAHGQCRYVDGDARAFEQAAAVGTRVADHTLWDGRGLRQLFDGHAATAGCRGRWLTRCSRCWLAGVSTRYRSGSPAGGSSPLPWLQT